MWVSSSQACQLCVIVVFWTWSTPCHGSGYNPRSIGYTNSTSSTSSETKSSFSSSSTSSSSSSSSSSSRNTYSSSLSSRSSFASTTVEILTKSVIPQPLSTHNSTLETSSSGLSKSSSWPSLSRTSSLPLRLSTGVSSHTTTSSKIATRTSDSYRGPITPAPKLDLWDKPFGNVSWGTTWPWGAQKIKTNTCSDTTDANSPWGDCSVAAGTMHLSYFPAQSGNVSYPTTHWAAELSTMMTSPSIYMVVKSIHASNSCGQLGPTYNSVVIAVNPSALSTIPPYANAAAKTRIGPTRVLTISDIASGCADSAGKPIVGEYVVKHPVAGVTARCNPQVVWPQQLLPMGGPLWKGCWKKNHLYGLYDPPGSVPPASGLFASTKNILNAPEMATVPAKTSASPVANAPANSPTQTNAPASTSAPANVPLPVEPVGSSVADIPFPPSSAVQTPSAQNPSATSSSGDNLFINVEPSGINIMGTDSSSTFFANPSPTASQSADPEDPAPGADPTTPVVATIPASQITNPVVVPPTGQPATIAFVPPTGQPAVNSAPVQPSNTVIAPVLAAVPSSIVIGGQTANLGGPPVTVGSSIVQLMPSGIVVHDVSGGLQSTIVIPTQAAGQQGASASAITIAGQAVSFAPVTVAPVPTNPAQINTFTGQSAPVATIAGQIVSAAPGAPVVLATIGGQVVSAAPEASTVVIQGQTATIGGAPITLTDSNLVASLGPSALVIQYPGGAVSSYALPTTGTKASPVIPAGVLPITVGGQVITAATPGASTLVFGSQTLSIGGPPMTIAGGNVLSLSPSGLIVAIPGGQVTTLALPAGSYKATSTAAGSTSSSINGVGGMIASIIGVTNAAPASTSPPVKPANDIAPTTTIVASIPNQQSSSSLGYSAFSTPIPYTPTGTFATTAPGSAATRLSVRCTSIIPLISAVIVFGILW